MGIELNTQQPPQQPPPQPARPRRPRISAGMWRVMSDGMSTPGVNNPLGESPHARKPLGIDHWIKRDREFRFTKNQAEVYIDGQEAFPAMEKLLREAKSNIRFDYYIFSGEEGRRLAEIMVERHKAGVDVRVQLDPHHGEIEIFSETENQIIAYLKANGVQVDDYPIERIQKPKHQHEHIDHNKFLIVDGQRAMVGGMNIADPFLNNHDVMVQIAGPAVTTLKCQFDETWAVKHPNDPKPRDLPPVPPSGDALVRVVGTGIDGRRSVQSALTHLIQHSQKRIYVNMFELTSPQLVDELIKAKKRGVDVRILADPGDHGRWLGLPLPKGFPNLPSLYRLTGSGIQVRSYSLAPDQVADHMKLAIIDDTMVVGSANFTDAALESNAETSLEIRGGTAYQRMLHTFVNDWNTRTQPLAKPTLFHRGVQTLIDWVY